MPTEIKRKALIFLLMTVLLTGLMAVALPQLELKPGISLPASEVVGESLPQDQVPAVAVSINTYLKAALEITLVLVIVYGIYRILKGAPWKKVLIPAILIAILVMAVFYIFFIIAGARINSDPFTPEVLPPEINIPGPPLGPLPKGLIWLAWVGLAFGIGLLGIWLILRPRKNTRIGASLELEAERALQALRNGSSLNNVIVRCYIQMSQALQKEQEIELEQTMTAREFEQLLEDKGIPYAPVHQLTQLFEAARYGFKQAGPDDEQKAFESLSAILKFSRAKGQPG